MTAQALSAQAATYVYCIAQSGDLPRSGATLNLSPVGGERGAIRLLRAGGLVAVVSDSPQANYDLSRANLLAHERVVDAVNERATVLPLRFGMVATSDEQVKRLLLRERATLRHALERLRGRIELGLKVLWNPERLFAEIAAEDATIRALRDALAEVPPEAGYFERIRLGQLTAEALERKRDEAANSLLDRLHPMAVEAAPGRLLTDMMIVNAAFLVERSAIGAFDAAVQDLDRAEGGRMIFKYVGPLPPYNFVDLALDWEE